MSKLYNPIVVLCFILTPANKIVGIKVYYGEKNIGILVRKAGGTWNSDTKLWKLPYLTAVNLGLQDRIVPL
jgi:hypothetical protein